MTMPIMLTNWAERNPGATDKIFIATKFAFNAATGQIDSSPEFTRAAIETNLERLGLPCIDLFYVHRIDTVTPIEKTVEELKKLKQEGKIKYIGLSEVSSDTLRRACKVEHIDAVQIEYSPFSLEIESPQTSLLKTCRELGVAIVAYSPIGRGMLSGKIRSPDDLEEGDWRKTNPRFSKEVSPEQAFHRAVADYAELPQEPRARRPARHDRKAQGRDPLGPDACVAPGAGRRYLPDPRHDQPRSPRREPECDAHQAVERGRAGDPPGVRERYYAWRALPGGHDAHMLC